MRALTQLYNDPQVQLVMGPFTDAFRLRMVQLIEDKATSVAVLAVGLLGVLARQERLEPGHIDDVCALIADNDVKIRLAAGEFVNTFILEHATAQDVDSRLNAAKKKTGDRTERLHAAQLS